jgi:predicted XRE-type DNA-binding protein
MIGIITGDIVNSRKLSSKVWMNGFKTLLQTFGKNPTDWEIYRGDEFQLEVKNPEDTLLVAFQIKAFFKTLKLDVRMSIGLGEKTYKAKKITESNGTAFSRSGEVFENLKKQKINLSINSGNSDFDLEMNLMLRLCLVFMDNWLSQAAEFVKVAIEKQELSQEEIGLILGINQAAVSRRRTRAQFDILLDIDQYYRMQINKFQL